MKNGDLPTFPIMGVSMGLTKREWLAGMAMQGYLSTQLEQPEFVAAQCVLYADALLAELEKE